MEYFTTLSQLFNRLNQKTTKLTRLSLFLFFYLSLCPANFCAHFLPSCYFQLQRNCTLSFLWNKKDHPSPSCVESRARTFCRLHWRDNESKLIDWNHYVPRCVHVLTVSLSFHCKVTWQSRCSHANKIHSLLVSLFRMWVESVTYQWSLLRGDTRSSPQQGERRLRGKKRGGRWKLNVIPSLILMTSWLSSTISCLLLSFPPSFLFQRLAYPFFLTSPHLSSSLSFSLSFSRSQSVFIGSFIFPSLIICLATLLPVLLFSRTNLHRILCA